MATDFSEEIKQLRTTMDSVRQVTDLAALETRIADLEQQASDPTLWDDQEKAQVVTSGLSRAKAELDRVTGMDARIDDLEALVATSVWLAGLLGRPSASRVVTALAGS